MQYRSRVVIILSCFGLTVTVLSSCNGKGGHFPMADEEEYPASLTQKDEDTVEASPAIEETPVKPTPSAPANSATTSTEKTTMTEPDNMRGFDPASEDDMDDNGMSRYMENDDEEGWD